MADEQRLAVLEQHVRALYEQLGVLLAELRATEGGSSPAPAPPHYDSAPQLEFAATARVAPDPAPSLDPPPPPPPPPPRVRPPRVTQPPQPDIDLEKLLGRYGTIAVASLAILMGVGTFAGVGLWVRDKRDVRFGNVLLALSLAIVHVDAWAAGPHLQVLSTVSALAIAATASALLAGLALTSEERTLFAIGFAGALLAPFITAREPGSVVMLLTYAWVVIAISLFAIREKGWRPVLWLTVIGAAAYVVAAVAAGPGADHSWLAAHAPVIFAFACAAAGLRFAR